MRWNVSNFMVVGICGLILVGGTVAIARQQQSGAPHVQQQTGDQQQTPPPVQQAAGAAQTPAIPAPEDPIKTIVGRLDLEKYKATIKGLTQFGDRRQGTDRNRAAVNWIEAQLKSYGCTNTERLNMIISRRLRVRDGAPVVDGVARTPAKIQFLRVADGRAV